MQYTTLGKTGLKVSVAGLGCGGNSRIGLGTGLSEAQSVALVREALDLGVNFLDTANAYETEGVVGKAIKGRPRDSVVISTKSHATSAPPVLANLDNSLRQLDTDYVDIFHLHGLGPAAYDKAMAEIVPGPAAREGEGQAPPPRRIRDRPARPRAHHAGPRRGGGRAGRCSCWASA